jgi:hypothetical protein
MFHTLGIHRSFHMLEIPTSRSVGCLEDSHEQFDQLGKFICLVELEKRIGRKVPSKRE